MFRLLFAFGLMLAAVPASAATAPPVTAIVTAYEPEWTAILPGVLDRKDHDVGGVHFVSGTMAGLPVLVVESGIGPVNAALATQIAIDRFEARRIVNVGIAGGVDASLHLGDVSIPERWSEYLYSVFARSEGKDFSLPGFAENKNEHYGMIFPQPAEVGRAPAAPASVKWFDTDADLLAAARETASTKLARCQPADRCLDRDPQIVVGGNGVSGSAFVDNADFRRFLADDFHARATDMESAAIAHVAASNRVPFIAFRSLSDLAGGHADPNEMKVFEALAARNASLVLQAFLTHLHDRDAGDHP